MAVDITRTTLNEFFDYEVLKNFECLEPVVDHFIHEEAVESDKYHQTQTSLFFDNIKQKLVGYYSTSVGILKINSPFEFNKFKKLIPDAVLLSNDSVNDSSFEMPVLRLHYFGRDEEYRGEKFGKAILYNLFTNCIQAYTDHGIGLSGILLDATLAATDFYEDIGFQYVERNYTENDFSTKPRRMFIDIDTISEII